MPRRVIILGRHCCKRARCEKPATELERANRLKPDMPETLYSLGKAASLDGDAALAEKAWLRLIEIEKADALWPHRRISGWPHSIGNRAKKPRPRAKCKSSGNSKRSLRNRTDTRQAREQA